MLWAVQPGAEEALGRLCAPSCKEVVGALSKCVVSDRMQGDSSTLHKGEFNSAIRKDFFIEGMVKQRSRLLGTRPHPTGTEIADVVPGDCSSAAGGALGGPEGLPQVKAHRDLTLFGQ